MVICLVSPKASKLWLGKLQKNYQNDPNVLCSSCLAITWRLYVDSHLETKLMKKI